MKEQIIAMYEDAAVRLDQATTAAAGTEEGSQERYAFERIYGERYAYSRILKELHGMTPADVQAILDVIYNQR